ncbi:MAG: 7-cyano-7-deazaguanine synthase [Nitrososphaera sp.]|nr:7-cyano-7-deazaguanine synthase [Nitrososphaera sp.]
MGNKALVMLSGGLDSATCLYWAKTKFSEVSAITFNYFGRLRSEKRAAAALAKRAGVAEMIEIDLPFVKEASDFYNGRFSNGMGDRSGLWSSYVPARNMVFYSIAAHYAEFLGVKRIIGGHNAHDINFFKDASKSYIEKINALFKEGCLLCNGSAYRILLPLAGMQRSEIVRLAIKLKTPIELTWSCHRKGSVHCGSCYSCTQRLEAFQSLGMTDPVFRPA